MEKKMKIKTMFTVIMILTMFSGVKAETVENLERMRAKTLTVMFDKNINLNMFTRYPVLGIKILNNQDHQRVYT